ncbi:SHOCT domain-containing protein [Chloroflexota bacterium]
MNKTLKAALMVGGTVIGLLILIPLIFSLVVGWGYGGWGMMGLGMMGGSAGMGLMSIIWIGVFGLITWAIMSVAWQFHDTGVHTANSALNILKSRYATGGISKDEYEDRKKELV